MAVAVDIIGVVVVIAAVAPMTFLTRHFTGKKNSNILSVFVLSHGGEMTGVERLLNTRVGSHFVRWLVFEILSLAIGSIF